MESFLSSLRHDLPPVVYRKDLPSLTGGLFNAKTLANKDSKGIGIPGLFYIGRNAAYPRESVLLYLEKMMHPSFPQSPPRTRQRHSPPNTASEASGTTDVQSGDVYSMGSRKN